MKSKRAPILGFVVVVVGSTAVGIGGCHPTSHPVVPATLGKTIASHEMEIALDQPGPILVETVIGADWAVPREGMIDLGDPKAKAAALSNGLEPIHLAMHVVSHPTRGTYLIDTGAERALRDSPSEAALSGPISWFIRLDNLVVRTDTAAWVAAHPGTLKGVFITHLHTDHIAGMRDVPNDVPVFTGPGETRGRSVDHLVTRGVVNEALEGKGPLQEWAFSRDADGVFAGIIDIFGDKSVFALAVPRHTPGSTAFVARTPSGPGLFTGDACHTRWGWEHDVPPGTFSRDVSKSRESLAALRGLARRHPSMKVHLGHQR